LSRRLLHRPPRHATIEALDHPKGLATKELRPAKSADREAFVLSGKFIIDLKERSLKLLPGQGFVVPKGVMHCTRSPERSVILMVETAAITPTGDA
jgi:mannose-6-phosphate isomerase-like protein (cupin superfamily)